MEYKVTGTGNIPEEHNVTGAKIEILGVDGKKIDVKITSTYSDGREENTTATLNLETGQIGDCFIIPANLNEDDKFPEQTEGTITIRGDKKTLEEQLPTVLSLIKRANDCVGCGICISQCPQNALFLKDDKIWVTDDCKACFACLTKCPVRIYED